MKFIADLKIYKYILKMALPAIAGLSTQMIVSLVDTAMVGRLDNAEHSLAAMGLGVLATWAFVSFFSSLATGTHVLIARRFGGKDYEGCGDVLNTSLIISFITGILIGAVIVGASFPIAHFFAADDTVGELAGEYLFYRFMGLPFFLLTVSYRGFFFGIGKTKIFMFSGILVNFLNIIFNYFFIFGMFGFKGMGLAGAGLGSSLATVCDAIFYFSITSIERYREKYKYFRNFKCFKDIANSIIKISLPVSFQNVFILIGFLSFVALTGIIGTREQAASQVVISCLMISLMPCFGFGIAVQTLVGNQLGSGKFQLAKYYGFETSKVATVFTFIVGMIFIFAPRFILQVITNDQGVIETAVPVLRIAGFGQIFYAVGVSLANGLQAMGQTFFVMVAEVIANWVIFIPLSYLLGSVLGFGLIGAWSALPFYVIVYTIIIFVKFKYGKQSKVVNV